MSFIFYVYGSSTVSKGMNPIRRKLTFVIAVHRQGIWKVIFANDSS